MNDLIYGIGAGFVGILGAFFTVIRRDSSTRKIVDDHEMRIRGVEVKTNSGEIKLQNVCDIIRGLEKKVDEHHDKIMDILIEIKGGQK